MLQRPARWQKCVNASQTDYAVARIMLCANRTKRGLEPSRGSRVVGLGFSGSREAQARQRRFEAGLGVVRGHDCILCLFFCLGFWFRV